MEAIGRLPIPVSVCAQRLSLTEHCRLLGKIYPSKTVRKYKNAASRVHEASFFAHHIIQQTASHHHITSSIQNLEHQIKSSSVVNRTYSQTKYVLLCQPRTQRLRIFTKKHT